MNTRQRTIVILAIGMSMIISGCGTGQLFEPTVRPTASFTLSGPETTHTETPTPTLRPTDTLAPTEAIPDFYHGLAPTWEQFPVVDKADISNIIAYLRSQPSLLSPDAPAVEVAQRLSSPDGSGRFSISCFEGSCVLAASVQIQDQGYEPYIVIWEVKTQNGGRGYLLGYVRDPVEYTFTPQLNDKWLNMLAHGSGVYADMSFTTGQNQFFRDNLHYNAYLLQQPGLLDAIDAWHATGILPPELENMILMQTGLHTY